MKELLIWALILSGGVICWGGLFIGLYLKYGV